MSSQASIETASRELDWRGPVIKDVARVALAPLVALYAVVVYQELTGWAEGLGKILDATSESARLMRALLMLVRATPDPTTSCVPSDVVQDALTLLQQLAPEDVGVVTSIQPTPRVTLSTTKRRRKSAPWPSRPAERNMGCSPGP